MHQNIKIGTAIGVLIISIFLLPSCEETPSSEQDSFTDFVNSIQPIVGATDITMDLVNDQGQDSKFLVTYSGIETNSVISNGEKRAWCVEWDISAIYSAQNNINLYSTKDTEYWKEINYLLSKEEQLRQENPNLGWREMQVAIWSLVKYKDFDIDKIPEYQSLGRYYKEGEYLFDVELAKTIVEQVKSEATATGNQKFAVIAENAGQTIITASE